MAGEKLEAAKQGMTAFLSLLSSERADAVGLISFSNRAEQTVRLSGVAEVGDVVESRIRGLHAEGRTALLDAVDLACEDVSRWSSHAQAIVLLTDGHENASTIDLSELEQRLKHRYGAPMILCVGYGDDADYTVLRRLAELTRGTALRGTVLNIRQLYQHMMRLL
jgi:Mg-chelatase subunit ChlD